jgi:hypothetical protein
MLRKVAVTLIWTVLIMGCRHGKPLQGPHPPEMVGTWHLLIRHSCDQFGVKSDTLALHPDGSFDQHVVLANGKTIEMTAQSWDYGNDNTNGHIGLNKRMEFFLPDVLGTRVGEGKSTFESLIVQLNTEGPVILLNPDWDCVYVKAQ